MFALPPEQLAAQFQTLSQALLNELRADEFLFLAIRGENSQFIRFNQAKVRQTGTVSDAQLTLTLIHNERTAQASLPFTSQPELDLSRSRQALLQLRQELPQLLPDPYIVSPQNFGSSRGYHPGQLLEPETTVTTILEPVQDLDFTGFYAGGLIFRGNSNSAGQHHWFATETFTLDYSLITATGKAVKAIQAGSQWSTVRYQAQIAAARPQLQILEQPGKTILPGQYRTYLAPAATAELVGMLSWGAVSEAALRQGESAFAPLRDGKHLSPKFSLSENFRHGQVPRFNDQGEFAPEELTIIASGRLVNTLVNSRTAKEYGLDGNGAAASEALRAPEVNVGQLNAAEVLINLDTGLYLSNLHYLNWSDRPQGRITGMTRYACFWVEAGEIVAPIQDLRFDESLYNCFGENLVDLTQTQEYIAHTDTYEYRALGGSLVPGLLVDNFTFTL